MKVAKIRRRSSRKKETNLKLLSKYGIFLHRLFCLGVTLYLVGLTITHYLDNEDTSVVLEKEFNETPKDVYPTYTICFEDKRTGIQIYDYDGIYRNWKISQIKGVKWPWGKTCIGRICRNIESS